MSTRLDALSGLTADLGQKQLKQQQQTQDILLQEQVRKQGLKPKTASQIAAANVAAKSQVAQQLGGQQVQQQQQLAQQQLTNQAIARQTQLKQLNRNLQEKGRRLEARLFRQDQRAKNQLLDQQLTFKKDELGRTLFNERQLADWKLSQVKTAEELKNYQQLVQQQSQRKMQILKAAHLKIKTELELNYKKEANETNLKERNRLHQAKKEMEAKLSREEARARSRASANGAIGQIGGAVIGGVLGTVLAPGVGTVAGAQAGASVGNGIAGFFS